MMTIERQIEEMALDFPLWAVERQGREHGGFGRER